MIQHLHSLTNEDIVELTFCLKSESDTLFCIREYAGAAGGKHTVIHVSNKRFGTETQDIVITKVFVQNNNSTKITAKGSYSK